MFRRFSTTVAPLPATDAEASSIRGGLTSLHGVQRALMGKMIDTFSVVPPSPPTGRGLGGGVERELIGSPPKRLSFTIIARANRLPASLHGEGAGGLGRRRTKPDNTGHARAAGFQPASITVRQDAEPKMGNGQYSLILKDLARTACLGARTKPDISGHFSPISKDLQCPPTYPTHYEWTARPPKRLSFSLIEISEDGRKEVAGAGRPHPINCTCARATMTNSIAKPQTYVPKCLATTARRKRPLKSLSFSNIARVPLLPLSVHGEGAGGWGRPLSNPYPLSPNPWPPP